MSGGRPPNTGRRARLLAADKAGVARADQAERFGLTPASLRVTLCRLRRAAVDLRVRAIPEVRSC